MDSADAALYGGQAELRSGYLWERVFWLVNMASWKDVT